MNGIHTMVRVRNYETGAVVWSCTECEFICIIKDDVTIPIVRGDMSVYHVTEDEKRNEIHDHNEAYKKYWQEYGEVAKTAFFYWIIEHREELENL